MEEVSTSAPSASPRPSTSAQGYSRKLKVRKIVHSFIPPRCSFAPSTNSMQQHLPYIPQTALSRDDAIRADACQLSQWPEEIFRKSKLKELILSRNLLAGAIPGAIGQLVSLRVLRLDRCLLTEVPSEVRTLSSLQTLDLSNNRVGMIEHDE